MVARNMSKLNKGPLHPPPPILDVLDSPCLFIFPVSVYILTSVIISSPCVLRLTISPFALKPSIATVCSTVGIMPQPRPSQVVFTSITWDCIWDSVWMIWLAYEYIYIYIHIHIYIYIHIIIYIYTERQRDRDSYDKKNWTFCSLGCFYLDVCYFNAFVELFGGPFQSIWWLITAIPSKKKK